MANQRTGRPQLTSRWLAGLYHSKCPSTRCQISRPLSESNLLAGHAGIHLAAAGRTLQAGPTREQRSPALPGTGSRRPQIRR